MHSMIYIASSALQLALAGSFTCFSLRSPNVEQARVQALSGGASMVASFAALLQAADFGTGPLQWVRYADYAVSTPMMVTQLHLLAGSTLSVTAFCALLQSLVVLAGFAGSQLKSDRLAFVLFGYGVLLFAVQFSLLFYSLSRRSKVSCESQFTRARSRFLRTFFICTMLAWTVYPTWWMLVRWKVSIVVGRSSLLSLSFDALCKGVLGFVLWMFSNKLRRAVPFVSPEGSEHELVADEDNSGL